MGEGSPGTPYVLGWDQVGLWSPKEGRHGKTRGVTCSHLLKVTSKGLDCGRSFDVLSHSPFFMAYLRAGGNGWLDLGGGQEGAGCLPFIVMWQALC